MLLKARVAATLVECFLHSSSKGRQAASEEGAVLPVERVGAAAAVVAQEGLPVGRVGAAAAVDCSCCRTCDVIIPPPHKGQKNGGAIKQRSNNPSPTTRDRKRQTITEQVELQLGFKPRTSSKN